MTHDSKFWDRVAEKYFAQPIGNPEAYEEKLRITQDYLTPDMNVLEFGCGTGGTALRHAPHVKHILATDISDNMLDYGRKQAAEANIENVDFKRVDIADFTAPDESYDAVLGMNILHLVEDREAVLRKVRKLIKPDGVFVSSTVCIGDTMGWLSLIIPFGRAIGKMPLVKVFKQPDLEASFKRTGFAIERVWRPEKSLGVFIVARPT